MAHASSSGSHYESLICTNPGFIQRYFQTSRLHHLSTWKADLCEYVGDVMGQSKRQHRSSSVKDFPRVIMHVDMDCFFASVGIRDRPHLRGKPVAVAHSAGGMKLDHSSSEIASCNYEARAKGLKNGMFLGSAKSIAPDLVIIPYEFDKYDACSRALYKILIDESDFVQAVSCDEAYIDLSHTIRQKLQQEGYISAPSSSSSSLSISAHYNTQHLLQRIEVLAREHAETIRRRVHQETQGCNASIGISHNLLLARIATSRAKPNGVFFLTHSSAQSCLRDLSIRDLPGVGWSMAEKCSELQLSTCGDVQSASSLKSLQRELGDRTGEMIYAFAHGEDDRVLENKPRQTLGAEINWGVRFTNFTQIETFMQAFCDEVFHRLDSAHWLASHITVNAKKRLYTGEPPKFLGCGHCADFSKSVQLQQPISSSEALCRHALTLFKEMNLVPEDVRGIGVHLKKLRRKAGYGASEGGGGLSKYFAAGTSNKTIDTDKINNKPFEDSSQSAWQQRTMQSSLSIKSEKCDETSSNQAATVASPLKAHSQNQRVANDEVLNLEDDDEEEDSGAELVAILEANSASHRDQRKPAHTSHSVNVEEVIDITAISEGNRNIVSSQEARLASYFQPPSSSSTSKDFSKAFKDTGNANSRGGSSNSQKGGRKIMSYFAGAATSSFSNDFTTSLTSASSSAEISMLCKRDRDDHETVPPGIDKEIWRSLPAEIRREQLQVLRMMQGEENVRSKRFKS